MLTESQFADRVEQLFRLFDPCVLCPHMCRAKRLSGETGFCGAGNQFKIASWALHRGEEPPISGTRGSGTIFASHCTMRCVFCQNYPFSQLHNGRLISTEQLAEIFLELNQKGAHNLNFVTPTPFSPLLFEALLKAGSEIENMPVVYNTSGYERPEVLEILDGMVDIYLPDIKYSDGKVSRLLSGVSDYVEAARSALPVMYRQTGGLTIDDGGIARRGMIIRHLVLPGGMAGTRDSFEWIKRTIGTDVQVSLMCQYFPAYQANSIPGMDRAITIDEYSEAIDILDGLGFKNVWAQDPEIRGGA